MFQLLVRPIIPQCLIQWPWLGMNILMENLSKTHCQVLKYAFFITILRTAKAAFDKQLLFEVKLSPVLISSIKLCLLGLPFG